MLSKDFSWDFIMSREFIAVLTAVVAVIELINVVYSILSKNALNLLVTIGGIIVLIFLMLLTYYRWKIEQDLSLIKEYRSLMIPLEKLTARNKDTSVWKVVMDTLRNKKKLRPCWVYYFDEKGKNANTAFYDLNAELEKLSNPYRLWNKNTLSIGEKFKNLVVDNKELYKIFIEMINTESISKDVFSYDEIKKEHNDFYYRLKQSRNENAELRVLFIDEFFSPLPDIWFPNRIVIC